jgi:hypothetical protein
MQNLHAEPILEPTLNTVFEPLLADPLEPRIAVMPLLSDSYLQLDIGTSADLWQNETKDRAIGIDFGTFSLLERSSGFKFPVHTIDYMFGVNATWKKPLKNCRMPFNELAARVRLGHISAHFEDGRYDKDTEQWAQNDCPFTIPFTYSREYLNMVVALSQNNDYRVYAGYQYMFHTIPGDINPHSFQLGAEVATPMNSYLAVDFKMLPEWEGGATGKTNGFHGTWNLQAGMRLTDLGLNRVRITYNYFSGMSRHGMLFYRSESDSTLGLIVDL